MNQVNLTKYITPFMVAFNEGKTVYFRYKNRTEYDDDWSLITDATPFFDEPELWEFRVKPEKRWRAFQEGEIKVGYILRFDFGDTALVTLVNKEGFGCPDRTPQGRFYPWNTTNIPEHQYSSDGGRTWSRWGVIVASKLLSEDDYDK